MCLLVSKNIKPVITAPRGLMFFLSPRNSDANIPINETIMLISTSDLVACSSTSIAKVTHNIVDYIKVKYIFRNIGARMKLTVPIICKFLSSFACGHTTRQRFETNREQPKIQNLPNETHSKSPSQ